MLFFQDINHAIDLGLHGGDCGSGFFHCRIVLVIFVVSLALVHKGHDTLHNGNDFSTATILSLFGLPPFLEPLLKSKVSSHVVRTIGTAQGFPHGQFQERNGFQQFQILQERVNVLRNERFVLVIDQAARHFAKASILPRSMLERQDLRALLARQVAQLKKVSNVVARFLQSILKLDARNVVLPFLQAETNRAGQVAVIFVANVGCHYLTQVVFTAGAVKEWSPLFGHDSNKSGSK
mmetsp:Transcript_22523/g.49074  ORF Transcript_22523/g.49074 Transcript_22523/m.49074 type:complete len:236 (+) Transcript_22523:285-992(+)